MASCGFPRNDEAHTSETSDDSYDSEEERFAARQGAGWRGAALRAEQAAAAELLHTYRARQQVRQQLEDAAVRLKLEQQHQLHMADDAREPSSAYDQAAQETRGDGGSSSPGGKDARTRVLLRALRQHEGLWEAWEGASSHSSSGGSSMAYTDVPWPPLDCTDYLLALAAEEQQRQQKQGQQQQQHHVTPGTQADCQQAQRAQRRAYARACLRWHPDKFVARWGRLLAEADRARILERVQQLSQGINQAWEALQQQHQPH